MMKSTARIALIVGGDGQIGRAVARDLLLHGWRVRVARRSARLPPPDLVGRVETVELDRDQPGALAAALSGGADAVIDTIAFTEAHARQWLELDADIDVLAVISSVSIYCDAAGRTMDEAQGIGFPQFPIPITEDQTTVAPGPETYPSRKAAVEQTLLQNARCPVIVLRPGAVHGEGSRHPREWWFIKLLLCEGLGEKETGLVRKIATNATQAARLIDQLLDVTRSRLGGGISIDLTRFDLNDVCQQVIDETELTHPERPLRVDVHGDLTGVWDRDRTYQLLANLVGNAVHHGEPRSPIELRIDGGETAVVIDVANQGEPIPPATLPFIFDAFRKGRTVHPSRTQGLGLGLFIVRQIARSHGGSIAVTSSASDGTTFRVRLPRGGPISQHSRHAS